MADHAPESRSRPSDERESSAGQVLDPAARALLAWLDGEDVAPFVWLCGHAGSGRSTAMRRAVGETTRQFSACKFVECYSEMHFEEILLDIGTLLEQSGDSSATAHVRQRNSPRSKVRAVLRALRERPVLLVLDTFDRLDGEGFGAEHAEFIAAFLENVTELLGGKARLAVIAETPPPVSSPWHFVPTSPWSFEQAGSLWDSLAAGAGEVPALSFSDVPSRYRDRPLTLKLLFQHARRDSSHGLAKELLDEGRPAMTALVDLELRSASLEARSFLIALAAFPPVPTRRALRDVLTLIGWSGGLDDDPRSNPVLEELLSRGLLELFHAGGKNGRRVRIRMHSEVRAQVARLAAGTTGARWEALQAAAASYYLRRAKASDGPWDLVRAWRRFVEGKFHDEAYEVQKSFLIELIQRGYADLVRTVLELTADKSEGTKKAVALGNLAMVHKNTGNLGDAERLYGAVFVEFESAGDLANAARTLHQLGNTQYARGSIEEALASYERSVELSSRIGHEKVAAVTRVQIGNSLALSGRSDEALAHFELALETLQREHDPELAAAVQLQIALLHLEARRHLEAETHLAAAESAARDSGDLRSLQRILRHSAAAARARREDGKARAYFAEALASIEQLGDGLEAAACLIEVAELEAERLQLADSVRCALTARSLLERLEPRGERHAVLAARVATRLAELREHLGEATYGRIATALAAEE